MIGLYIGALAFGGILIGVSILLGGGDGDFDKDFDMSADADFDVDADIDVDVDVDADFGGGGFDKDFDLSGSSDAATAAMWLPFLSMRFWTFGAAGFGLVGSVLHPFAPWLVTLAAACFTGSVAGLGAAWFFRQLKVNTVTASVGLKQFVGREARVLLPVAPGEIGKIVIDDPQGQLELTARTQDHAAIRRGARVLITDVTDGTANVTSMPTLESTQQVRPPERTPQ